MLMNKCFKQNEKPDLLYIITTYFNPSRSQRRFQLHKEFHERLKDHENVILVTVECAFYDAPFEMTSKNKEPLEIQVSSKSVFWIKENLINIALGKLFKNKKFREECQYVAWVDADIEFMDVDWFQKLKASLTHYSIIQMFKYALFMDLNQNTLETHISFGYHYAAKKLKLVKGEYPHPGYAWCTTKSHILKLGEIYDKGVMGSGDTHMAFALVGKYEKGFLNTFEYDENFKKSVEKWQKKAIKVFKKKVGYVDMGIRHFWHGKRESRQQIYRWQLLQDFNFNPLKDLIKSKDGHYEITLEKKALETKLYDILLKMKLEEEEKKDDTLDIPEEKKSNIFIYFQKFNAKENFKT